MFASLLVPLAVSIAALAAGNPTLPTRYHVKGNIILPSGQIVEPYEAWVDLEKGNSRIDYYGGKEVGDNNIVLFGCLLCTYICSPCRRCDHLTMGNDHSRPSCSRPLLGSIV